MIGAGLLAKKAVELGLTRKPWVKSVCAGIEGGDRVSRLRRPVAVPGSLGFNLVGYGCTTCIGNSARCPTTFREIRDELVVARC
jgi:aconitate hydratase